MQSLGIFTKSELGILGKPCIQQNYAYRKRGVGASHPKSRQLWFQVADRHNKSPDKTLIHPKDLVISSKLKK